jgi:hypothetical protein
MTGGLGQPDRAVSSVVMLQCKIILVQTLDLAVTALIIEIVRRNIFGGA